jgi:hypothetical protein
MGMKQ